MDNSLKYSNIWKITLPVMLSLLAQNFINLTDTIFLGRVGEVELGASAIGGLFYYGVFVVGFGFSIGTQILISRRNGERQYSEIGATFVHSLYFLLALGAAMIVLVQVFAPAFLRSALASEHVAKATWAYLDIRIWGILFSFIGAAFRAFYIGILKPAMLSWAAAIMAILNILLAYMMIFGKGGMPVMGISGAALASLISEAVGALFLIAVSLANKYHVNYRLFFFERPRWGIIRHTLEVSVFTMLQNFMAMGGWLTFFIIIEQSGERPLAVSNIIRSIYIMLMIPLWAFGTNTNSIVSNLMGEGKTELVIPAIRRITLMSIVATAVVILAAALFP
jgi:putative MATE family efflux protein